jgi:hypothetical protein
VIEWWQMALVESKFQNSWFACKLVIVYDGIVEKAFNKEITIICCL